MLDAPERTGARFSIFLFLGYLLAPLTGFSAAVLFGVISIQQLQQVLAVGIVPTFSISLVFFSLFQSQRLITPLATWAMQNPGGGNAPGHLHTLLNRFSRDFWGLMALHALISPALVFWSLDGGITADNRFAFTHLLLLQIVSTILVGMPAYLFGLHQLGKLAGYLSLNRVMVSLKSRTLLLTGLVPLLSYSVLVEYHWLRTGELDSGYMITWITLGVITATISLLSIRSMQQALHPFQQLFSRSGASTHEDLANLRPASTDEIGHLTQTLGKVFQRLGDQETHMRAVIDTAAEGIIVVDENGLIDTFNPARAPSCRPDAWRIRGQKIHRCAH
jgi:PAS domain-containing protein